MAGVLPPGIDLSKVPLLANPSGAPPNFVDPPSLHNAVTGVGIALMVVSGILLILRLITNRKISRLGLDDYLCIFAQAGGMSYWILYHMVSERGISKHAWDIPLTIMNVSFIKLQASIQIVAAPTLWAAKSAILALYIRLFGSIRWLKIICYILITLMALFYGSNIVIAVVYCIPRKNEAWDGTSFARCSTSTWSAVMIGVFSACADLVIFILPFPVILKLRVTPAKKVGLVVLFMTGLLLVILSILSLVFRIKTFRGVDPTWNATSTGIVTFAEVFGTVMVACAPALSAFWFKILTKSSLWSSFVSRKTQSSEPVATNLHFNFDSTSILKDKPSMSSDGESGKSEGKNKEGKNKEEENEERKGLPYLKPWADGTEKTGPSTSL